MADVPPSNTDAFFSELFDSVDAAFDPSTGTARRRWRVPRLIIGDGMPAGFPVLTESHPRYPLLFLDKLSVESRTDQFSTIISGDYSTDGRFRKSPTKPPADTTRGYLSIVNERADLTIPFFVATKRSVQKYSSNPTTGAKILTGIGVGWEWKRFDLKTKTHRAIVGRDITLTSFGIAQIKLIYTQLGNIHVFPDGTEWMFNVPDINQISANRWKVRYQWESEWEVPVPGKPKKPGEAPVPPDPSINPLVLANYYVTATEVRPPFYAYQVIPGAFEIGIPDGTGNGIDISVPAVRIMDRFPDSRNNPSNPTGLGWRSLPGAPLSEYI